jgi:hypothetical protein
VNIRLALNAAAAATKEASAISMDGNDPKGQTIRSKVRCLSVLPAQFPLDGLFNRLLGLGGWGSGIAPGAEVQFLITRLRGCQVKDGASFILNRKARSFASLRMTTTLPALMAFCEPIILAYYFGCSPFWVGGYNIG